MDVRRFGELPCLRKIKKKNVYRKLDLENEWIGDCQMVSIFISYKWIDLALMQTKINQKDGKDDDLSSRLEESHMFKTEQ